MQSQSLETRSNGVALPNNAAGLGVRSVHFAPSVEMPSRTGGQSSVLGHSRARNAPYAPPSTAPSARSWVYPYNQHQPTPLPASPTDQPDALPGPFHKRKGLHAILGDDDDLDDTDNTQTNSLGIDFGHHPTEVPSSKNKGKKSIIGRVFRGVGTVFGKESRSGGRKIKRQATASYDTVPTLATYADSSSNSNSATYGVDAPGPSSTLAPGPRVPYTMPTPILEVPETEDHNGSPTPEVLRLSDNIPPLQSRARPPATITNNPSNHRPKSVSRKPVNAGAPSRFVEAAMTTESAISHNNNNDIYNHPDLEDRTTVMIYEQNLSRAPTGVQTPSVISRHPSSTRASVHPELGTGAGAGLPFQSLRPTSFAATQLTHAGPGSVRDPVSVAPTRRTSIASPLAPRSRQLSLNRGVVGQATSASSIPDFPPGPYPPHPSRAASTIYQPPPVPLPLQTTTATNPELTSPISAHPLPTEDYLKMTLSPPSSKHTVTTSNTTYSSNPSFSSDLSPFVRFVKILYKMPWISHDRVTVDYLPDHGLLGAKNVKGKKGKVKRTATWYRSMLASRRNSDNPTTDLLGRGGRGARRRQRDLDVSLGAALAELGSPFAATKRRKGRTERSRRHHHQRHHHHHSSSRHHHHGRRATATTMTDDSTIDSVLQTTTPLPHAMYPYFPPFPIAFQPPFAQNEHSPPATAGLATHAGVQPNGAAGAAYQPLFSPTPFYVFPPGAIPPPGPTAGKHAFPGGVADHNMKTSNGSAIPPVLVPGGVDTGHIPGAFS